MVLYSVFLENSPHGCGIQGEEHWTEYRARGGGGGGGHLFPRVCGWMLLNRFFSLGTLFEICPQP